MGLAEDAVGRLDAAPIALFGHDTFYSLKDRAAISVKIFNLDFLPLAVAITVPHDLIAHLVAVVGFRSFGRG